MPSESLLFGTSQSATRIIECQPNERLVVTRVSICCDNANTADVGASIGFGKVAQKSWTGHPGIAAGSGLIETYNEHTQVEGGLGEHILFSCETPTGGGIQVSVTYHRHIFRT